MRHSQVHDRMGNMSMTRMRTARTMKMKPMLNNRLSHRHNQSHSQMLHHTAQRPIPNSSSSSSWAARVLHHKVTRRSLSSFRRYLLPWVLYHPELRRAVTDGLSCHGYRSFCPATMPTRRLPPQLIPPPSSSHPSGPPSTVVPSPPWIVRPPPRPS